MRKLLLALGLLAVGAGLWAFEPWRALTSSEIDEALPTTGLVARPTTAPTTSPAPVAASTKAASTEAAPAPAAPIELSRGSFVDAEHGTDGTARIIELADGRRFLRLEGLATSDGPDLHVWLSDAKPGGSWFSYDDGAHLALGELKATRGNQNYPIPAGADLNGFRSAVIWCDRFNVAFGAAPVSVS